MTAPARTATPARGRATTPTRRLDAGVPRRNAAVQRGRSPAIARAYARRAQRAGTPRGGADSVDTGRMPFVMLVMSLLGTALVATLWLSTAATADSYHLESARKQARDLTERVESLSREVATLETAPELARRARELGMVPAGDPARLVVGADGAVALIGQPRRATAPLPPPVRALSPVQPPPVPPAAAVPVPPAVGPVPPAAAASVPPPGPPAPAPQMPAAPSVPVGGT